MPTNILMPALSPTMEKGNLSKWIKKEGDSIKAGDVIAEIETDKATMEVEAVDEGVLARIVVPEGTADVPVNDVIGVIASEGEDAKAVKSTPSAPAGAPAAAAPVAPATALNGSAPAPAAAPTAASQGGMRLFASPLARRIAKEAALDLATLTGSGPHGRIVQRDVTAAIAAGPKPAASKPAAPVPAAVAAPAAAPTPATPVAATPAAAKPAGASDDMTRKLFAPGSFTEIPHDSMRKTIARRLVEAKSTIPHFYLTVDCQLDALLTLRETVNAAAPKDKDGKPAFKVSVNDFIIKALALALQRVPDANVTWTESAMLKHVRSDIGVAVSIPGGLITPVVRSADTKTLSMISNEMKDLAGRARARKLKPEEYQGGTSAVSNLGMFGVKSFSAVINPPQATILAVGAGESRVVVKAGAPAVATIMSATLSTDHRAVDGALGAELISAFKKLIEAPMGMLV
jgi:pyruvate dehydrogenase E2 component (dihydrolipoamide acetyltransferase)